MIHMIKHIKSQRVQVKCIFYRNQFYNNQKKAVRPREGTVEMPEKDFPELHIQDIIQGQKEDLFCKILKCIILDEPIPYEMNEKEKSIL